MLACVVAGGALDVALLAAVSLPAVVIFPAASLLARPHLAGLAGHQADQRGSCQVLSGHDVLAGGQLVPLDLHTGGGGPRQSEV